MLEINWYLIPVITLIFSLLLFLINNGFKSYVDSEGGLIFGFITAVLFQINIIFYGIWGLYWLISHIKII